MYHVNRGRAVWSLTLISLLVATVNLAPPPVAQASGALVADYQFQRDLRSVMPDGPALSAVANSPRGTPSYPGEPIDGVAHTVYAFPVGNGLGLNTNTLTARNAYTIVLLCRVSTPRGFAKLVDFKDGSEDPGLYVYDGALRFYPEAAGAEGAITGDAYVQIVLTRDAAHTVVAYLDGQPQFTFADAGSRAVIGATTNLRFFVDDRAGSEQSGGAVARLRVYDGALSASEVAALDRLP